MALIPCHQCQNQIADDAPSCPKCGSPRMWHFRWLAFFGLFFPFYVGAVAALFLLLFLGCYFGVLRDFPDFGLLLRLAILVSALSSALVTAYVSKRNGDAIAIGGWVFILSLGSLGVFHLWGESIGKNVKKVLSDYDRAGNEVVSQANVLDVAWDQSGLVKKMVVRLKEIDTSGCPAYFRSVFKEHIKAWEKYETVAQKFGGFRGFVRGFFSGGPGVLDALAEANDAQKEIVRTYKEFIRYCQQMLGRELK